MVSRTKKDQKADLEKIAASLAKIHITPAPNGDHLVLRAAATFTTRSFDAGDYKVSVGVCQAFLRLESPAYDTTQAYQATLSKEAWSERWKSANSSQLGGEAKFVLGFKVPGWFGASAQARAAKNRQESTEAKANTPYPLVTAIPGGWRIGTELGDPRDPQGTLPDGLRHCLDGEYLTERRGEQGDGFKDEKSGKIALCELLPKSGANDYHITATLFGSSDSLKVAISRSDGASTLSQGLGSQVDQKQREDAMRNAFVEICIQRAKVSGTKTDDFVTGDFYLTQHEVVGPRPPPQPFEKTEAKSTNNPTVKP
jgi:hypothetical protein